ncbi:MAG TPA: hypothetical protein VHM28_02700 [Anaerolineales bacterium]|nr:hypothetical protein [Anaerolineales bacterium]
MFDLFSSLPVRNKEVTNSYLQTLLKIEERELFTGVLHVQNGEKGQVVLLFQQGAQSMVYSLRDGGWRSVSKPDWKHELAQAEGDMRVLALPVEGLRTFRVFLELEKNEAHTSVSMNADQIPAKIADWEQTHTPSLLHVQQHDIQAFFIVSGEPGSSLESLLVGAERFQSGAAVLAQIKSWGPRACLVTRLPTDLESPAGNEYILRMGFSSLVQKALERYQELAGRFLVAHLNDEINALNEQNHWSMYFSGTNIVHREFFADTEQAGRIYRILLEKMRSEMNLVVGSDIAAKIFTDALATLSPRPREWLEKYVPEGIPVAMKVEVKS